MNTPADRDPVEMLATEFLERRRQGENPTISEYTTRYPEIAEDIRDLFPTILMMERSKQQWDEVEISVPGTPRCSPEQPPEWLGDYRLLGEIGRGGMGVVYEAEQQSLGRRVAIKVLPRAWMREERNLLRFQREARLAARLHHTNIVPVFGVGEQDGLHFYVMQLIRGVGVDAIIREMRQDSPGDNGCSSPPASYSPFSPQAAARALCEGRFAESGTLTAASEMDKFSGLTSSEGETCQPAPAAGDCGLGGRPNDAGKSPHLPGPAPQTAIPLPSLLSEPEAPPEDLDTSTDQGRFSEFPLANPTSPAIEEDDGLPPPESRVPSPEPARENPSGSRLSALDSRLSVPVVPTQPHYWRSVARIGVQLADALHYAHLQGTVHRDVKPGNILLDARGVVWLTDFGLARDWDQETLNRSGDIAGTLLYVAPEQLEGEPGPRSDLYSLGATLYELLTLQSAFANLQPARLMQQILSGRFPPPRSLCADIPRDLETIVLKAMARDPDRRYSSAGDLRDDLERYLADRPIRARRTSPLEHLWRWCRRNRAIASLAATALGLLVLVVVLTTTGYIRTRQANQQVQQALLGEKQNRRRAEASSLLAQQAINKIFDRFNLHGVTSTSSRIIAGEEEEEIIIPAPPVLSREDAALLEELLGYYEQLAELDTDDLHLFRRVAVAQRRIGDIRFRLGQLDEAIASFQGALTSYERLQRSFPGDWEILAEKASILIQTAIVLGAKQRFWEARQAQRRALVLLRSITQKPTPARVRYEQAHVHYLLARMGPGWGRMPGRPRSGGLNRGGMRRWAAKEGTGKGPQVFASPAEHRNEAIRLLDELALEHPTIPDYRFLLALCYREVPRSGFRPDIDAIVAASDKAASELEALVEKFPTVPDYRHELIVTYTLPTLRESSWSREFLPLAEDRLRKAWVLAQQLVLEHPNVPRYANARVSVQMRLASVLLRTNRPVEAERHYQQALRTQRSLDRRFPEVQGYHFRLLTLLDRLARLLRGQNRLTEARPLMEEAIEVSQTVWKKAPRTRMRRNLLADRYRRLGEVLNSLGEKEKAEEAFAKAREQRARPGRPQKMTR